MINDSRGKKKLRKNSQNSETLADAIRRALLRFRFRHQSIEVLQDRKLGGVYIVILGNLVGAQIWARSEFTTE